MNQLQFNEKAKEITKDLNKFLEVETKRLFLSGAIDVDKYGDNYLLPKIILTAALKNISGIYAPLSDESNKAMKNLAFF